MNDQTIIGVIGLGYVGLPLSLALSKKFEVFGFDISNTRISELKSAFDRTYEVTQEELIKSDKIRFTSEKKKLAKCNFFVVTVPTPIDTNNLPDLSYLKSASEFVASLLKPGDIVVYESTVFPGCTENVCVPILEQNSGLVYNVDFYCGYSPERINPGDKSRRVESIVKVTSGSTEEAAEKIDAVYASVITAGTHKAESIAVAEAAKVIENTQRDLNIALMNELSILFNKLEIDTHDVLRAAGTKWNFLNFQPGLVGGHCIGVDPYYLTFCAEQVGLNPRIILSGRKQNDGMSSYVADQVIIGLNKIQVQPEHAKILILGVTFKENCPDIRNSKIFDLADALEKHGCSVAMWDPLASEDEVKAEYGRTLSYNMTLHYYDAVILAVPHSEILNLGSETIASLRSQKSFFADLKGVFHKNASDFRL